MIKSVQGRDTKMSTELRNISWEEHLKVCGLTTLETRILRVDEIEGLKSLNGYENVQGNVLLFN